MPRIACDMDEVIVDTYAAQCAWLREARGCRLDATDLAGKKPGEAVSSADAAALEAVMAQGDFFADLPIFPDAVAVLTELAAAHELFIVTAAMDYPRSCGPKYGWLRQHLPFVAPERIVFCGDKGIIRADFLIDDSPRHFVDFVGTPLLYDAPHNRDAGRYERVRSWRDIAARFGVRLGPEPGDPEATTP